MPSVELVRHLEPVAVELVALSAGGVRGAFVEHVFDGDLPAPSSEPFGRREVAEAIVVGGFPELALGLVATRSAATTTAGSNR
jgi:hypothetical protein